MNNPANHDIAVLIGDSTLAMTKELTYTVALPASDIVNQPLWLTDLTSQVKSLSPDLVRAQVSIASPAASNNDWQAVFYDWVKPTNGGALWQDQNNNGIVDNGELQNSTTYPTMSLATADQGTAEVFIGRDSLSRIHDGLFLGLQRAAGNGRQPPLLALSDQRRLAAHRPAPAR
jgi:hypothetical protein